MPSLEPVYLLPQGGTMGKLGSSASLPEHYIKNNVEREIQPAPRLQPPQGQVLKCQLQGSQPLTDLLTNTAWSRTTHLNPALAPDAAEFCTNKMVVVI